jgi:hypothetical protein
MDDDVFAKQCGQTDKLACVRCEGQNGNGYGSVQMNRSYACGFVVADVIDHDGKVACAGDFGKANTCQAKAGDAD